MKLSLLGVAALGLVSCHESPQAAVAQTIDLTNAVCAVATDSPVGAPYVDVVCSIAQAGEQLVNVIVGAIGEVADAGGGAAPVTMSVPVEQIRIRLPQASAAEFIAAHKKK
jgi:hypothetical protein